MLIGLAFVDLYFFWNGKGRAGLGMLLWFCDRLGLLAAGRGGDIDGMVA